MQGLAVGQKACTVIGQAVVEDLGVLIPAVILQENEAFGARHLRRARDGDRFREERQLLAHPKRRRQAMDLVDLAKARRDQHAAIGKPVNKACLPSVQVALDTLGERRVGGRDALQNEVAALCRPIPAMAHGG